VSIADRMLELLAPLVSDSRQDAGDGDADDDDSYDERDDDPDDHHEELMNLLRWLRIDRFDRRVLNRQLAQFKLAAVRPAA